MVVKATLSLFLVLAAAACAGGVEAPSANGSGVGGTIGGGMGGMSGGAGGSGAVGGAASGPGSGSDPCSGPGRCFYVATTGDDANPGTLAEPFRTAQHGADVATQPGDTLYLRDGAYPEIVWLRDSGAPGMPITLANFPGERPTILSVGLEDRNEYLGHPVPIGWIVVEGLEITTNGIDQYPGGGSGIGYANLHHAVFRHNYIHDIPSFGLTGNAYELRIEGNILGNLGVEPPPDCRGLCFTYMMYSEGSNYTIINNIVYNVVGYGIHARGEACDYYSWARGDCPNGCAPDSCAGVEFAHANNWIVANNVFAYHQHASAIVIWAGNLGGGRATGWTIENNIFYKNCNGDLPNFPFSQCDWNGIILYAGDHLIQNNLFFAPGKGSIYVGERTSYASGGNIDDNRDPLFVNATLGTNDFHLLPGSPAINAGIDLSGLGLTTDIEGTPRPQDGAYDIGAYEFR